MASPEIYLLPNLVTLFRIAAIPLFVFLLLSAQPVLAALVFLLLTLTDAIDGLLARWLNQTSDLGKFLDPIADKILVISALICLIELRLVPALPVIIIIARDFVISAVRLSAAKEGRIIAASPWGKVKTISQIIAVLMLILNLPYAMAVLWFAVLLTLISGVDYIVRK